MFEVLMVDAAKISSRLNSNFLKIAIFCPAVAFGKTVGYKFKRGGFDLSFDPLLFLLISGRCYACDTFKQSRKGTYAIEANSMANFCNRHIFL